MSVLNTVYNKTVRKALPRKWIVYNDVPVKDGRLFDVTGHLPNQQAGLLDAIDELVQHEDHVVDVATGRGVAAVHEARAGATVTSFEASREMIEVAETTLAAADVDEAVSIEQALVGEPQDVWGDASDARVVHPSDLPEADVLVLDVEGAETDILDCEFGDPRAVIVETHPKFGAATAEVESLLAEAEYTTDIREYEPDDDSSKRVVVGQGVA